MKWRTYLLKLKSSLSNTRTGPVLLRIVRGWPLNKQKTPPAIAVPKKLSNTPWPHRGKYLYSEHLNVECCSKCQKFKTLPYLHVICCIAQQPTKCNGICHSSKVNKQNGRQGLNVKPISEVTGKKGSFSFDIKYETPTKPENRANRFAIYIVQNNNNNNILILYL